MFLISLIAVPTDSSQGVTLDNGRIIGEGSKLSMSVMCFMNSIERRESDVYNGTIVSSSALCDHNGILTILTS